MGEHSATAAPIESDESPREPELRTGELRFAEADERVRLSTGYARRRFLVVRVASIGPSARGRLRDIVDEAVERELTAHGASAPGLGSTSDRDAALSDQLFRARRVGMRGLCLSLGTLRAAVSPRGAIEAEDSDTLRFFLQAAGERPLVVLLDASDLALGAYGDPLPLRTLLATTSTSRPHDVKPAPAVTAAVTAPLAASSTRAPLTRPVATPVVAVAPPPEAWRAWLDALTNARGPQPLAAFERLFTQSYLPLSNAVAKGLADPLARHAAEEFRRTFSRAYADAFPTFAVTGKRPRMVFDAPDIAARMARLHGARATQLVLVDAMRWDLGMLVRDGLVGALGSRASLTDELSLFAALPSNTTRQIDALGRGIEALRAPPEAERESDQPVRGRTAEVIRRVKIGSRDVYKLDLVETKLRGLTGAPLDALPSIAQGVTDAVVRHAATLSARTLMFVFGDHGFSIDGQGTVLQGGSSPEEVIVPAFAFLLGEVH